MKRPTAFRFQGNGTRRRRRPMVHQGSSLIAVQRAARDYLRAGFVLVPIPTGTKAPTECGWNQRDHCITRDTELSRITGNVGVALAYSGLCTIDIDGARARDFFARHAIDIDNMLNAPDAVRIDSGRPHRAKLLYRVPPGVTLLTFDFGAEYELELRCATRAGLTVQDVLPPSTHPDTGRPYAWQGDWHKIPPLPDPMLQAWLRLMESAPGSEPAAKPDPVLATLRELDMVVGQTGPGVWAVKCPGIAGWPTGEHHSNPTDESGTAYFEASQVNNYTGAFKCHHHSCADKHLPDLLRYLRDQGAEIAEPETAEIIVTSLAGVAPETVSWLWPDRLALGKVALLAGDPGIGKSLLTCDIAARVSRGADWPGLTMQAPCGDVIFLSAEDDLADTIVPRLLAADADLKRIHAIKAVQSRDGKERTFSLARDCTALEGKLARNACKLLIIDPITAYLGDLDANSATAVRDALNPIVQLAARHNVAVLAVTHLNKGDDDTQAIYRIAGSLQFIAFARVTYAVTLDPEDRQRRLFLPVKSNIARVDVPGLAYTVIEAPSGAPRIAWERGVLRETFHDVAQRARALKAAARTQAREDKKVEQATEDQDWLRDQLQAGPRLVAEIKEAWHGSSDRLKAAKKALDVVSKNNGTGTPWFWALPEKCCPHP